MIKRTEAGEFIEYQCTSFTPKGGANVLWCFDTDGKKQDYYFDKEGEIKEAKTSKTREENIRQVRKSCERGKWIVRANRWTHFLTLTYKENMTDTKRLYEDVRRFLQRLKDHYTFTRYFCACEPQLRGAWHCHILLDFAQKFVRNEDIAEIWGCGFTKTQATKDIEDVGSYLTAYLTKLDGKKGTRLALYPAHFRFLRWSRRCNKPKVEIRLGNREKVLEVSGYELIDKRQYKMMIDEKEMSIDIRLFHRKKTIFQKKETSNVPENVETVSCACNINADAWDCGHFMPDGSYFG